MREEKILEDWNFWKRKLDAGVERREYLERAKSFLETDIKKIVYTPLWKWRVHITKE